MTSGKKAEQWLKSGSEYYAGARPSPETGGGVRGREATPTGEAGTAGKENERVSNELEAAVRAR
jgi:hypothetical protein